MRNKILMTLALLLTAVTGAWAQSTLDVVEFDVPAAWQNESANSYMTAGDLPGFKAVTSAEAQAWTGFPAEGKAYLIYAFDGDNAKFLSFKDGHFEKEGSGSLPKMLIFQDKSDYKIYYTYADPNAIDVTWNATTKTGTFTMPASDVLLQVEYEPTKVTMAANDNTMGTVEVSGESKVEWTADTWAGWTYSTKEYTVDDITITSTQNAYITENTEDVDYLHCLSFFVNENEDNSTVTFSTTGDPFTRIEFTMIDDYYPGEGVFHGVPNIQPADGWTFEGKSAVWEGEATKSLTLQSCSTQVSKITFFKGAIPEGVTVNTDGTFTVAKTATVTLTATPAEGYKFLYWADDQTNTNPVREVTIEPGEADMTYTAVFEEILYNVTFAEGIEEADKWKATPNTEVKKETKVDIEYTGTKKVIGVKAEKKAPAATGHALSASVVGEIVGSDGKAYAADDKDNLPEGVTAVAIIAYVGSATGEASPYTNGLAIAMKDAAAGGKVMWSSSSKDESLTNFENASQAVTTAQSGRSNSTTSGFDNESNYPAFYAALHNTITVSDGISAAAPASGTSGWFLPSLYQWNKIVQGLSGQSADLSRVSNDNYKAFSLNTKIEAAGGDGLQSSRYWSSTEYGDGNAWFFIANLGIVEIDYMGNSNYVRSAFAF